MILHADADYRYLGDVLIAEYIFSTNLLRYFLLDFKGPLKIIFRHRERQVGLSFGPRILDDHVHHDPGFGDGRKYFRGDSGLVRYLLQRDAGLVFIVGDARDHQAFHT